MRPKRRGVLFTCCLFPATHYMYLLPTYLRVQGHAEKQLMKGSPEKRISMHKGPSLAQRPSTPLQTPPLQIPQALCGPVKYNPRRLDAHADCAGVLPPTQQIVANSTADFTASSTADASRCPPGIGQLVKEALRAMRAGELQLSMLSDWMHARKLESAVTRVSLDRTSKLRDSQTEGGGKELSAER